MSKLKHIIENELDWVKNVNEQDNFINWFKSPGAPGKWIQKDTQSWIDYVQDVEYAMSVINSDITEMKTYSDRILDGDAKPKEIKENLDRISEFVTTRNNTNDIDDYITDMRAFLNHFTPYFGEDITMSDMVDEVGLSFEYAQENNINIHPVINENFDWVVNDTVSFLEVGEPLKIQAPKSQYKLHVSHGVGEDNGMWVPNWHMYDPDMLMRHIRILSWLQENYREGIYGLAQLWTEGETWVLSKQDNENIKSEFGEYDEEVGMWVKEATETDEDEILYHLLEWLSDELMDYGLREHDSYHQEDATIEDWKVTYFDEFGVEHAVKVNLPQV
jgi:hypothetical protein